MDIDLFALVSTSKVYTKIRGTNGTEGNLLTAIRSIGPLKGKCSCCNLEFEYSDAIETKMDRSIVDIVCSSACAKKMGWYDRVNHSNLMSDLKGNVVEIPSGSTETVLTPKPEPIEKTKKASGVSLAKTFCPECNGPAKGRGFIHANTCSKKKKIA